MDRTISNIRIFDKDINFLGEVDDFTSLFFIRKWDTYGEFEFHLVEFDRELIKKGNIIMVNNDGNKAGIIEHIEINEENGDDIKVKGYSLLYMLTYRLTIPPENSDVHSFNNMPIEDIMVSLIKRNAIDLFSGKEKRIIENLISDNSKGRGSVLSTFETRYANLCDELTKLCKANGLGMTIDLDYLNKKFIFKVLQGRDLTDLQSVNSPAIFSTEYDNVKKQSYIESNIGYKNCAYVAKSKSAFEKDIFIVNGELSGLDRRELVVDGSKSDFGDDLEALGRASLEEVSEIETYECEVEPLGYKDIWDLGDIVITLSKKYNFKLYSRVGEVKEVYESKVIKIEPIFGTIIPTMLDTINKSNKIDLK